MECYGVNLKTEIANNNGIKDTVVSIILNKLTGFERLKSLQERKRLRF